MSSPPPLTQGANANSSDSASGWKQPPSSFNSCGTPTEAKAKRPNWAPIRGHALKASAAPDAKEGRKALHAIWMDNKSVKRSLLKHADGLSRNSTTAGQVKWTRYNQNAHVDTIWCKLVWEAPLPGPLQSKTSLHSPSKKNIYITSSQSAIQTYLYHPTSCISKTSASDI